MPMHHGKEYGGGGGGVRGRGGGGGKRGMLAEELCGGRDMLWKS